MDGVVVDDLALGIFGVDGGVGVFGRGPTKASRSAPDMPVGRRRDRRGRRPRPPGWVEGCVAGWVGAACWAKRRETAEAMNTEAKATTDICLDMKLSWLFNCGDEG